MFINCKYALVFSQEDKCTLTIVGKVIDEHDKSELSFAVITIKENGKQALANEKGIYTFSSLCEGTYTIKCEHIGCESIEKKVILSRNSKVNFVLEHHDELLKEFEVISTKIEAQNTQSSIVIDEKSKEKQSGNTLGDILKEVSGVTTLSSGASIVKPVIHGLFGNRIAIINNGVKQEDQQWGNEHAPNIDPFASEKISIIKGAAAVQYGSDAIGGVVVIEQEKPKNKIETGINLIGQSNGKGGAFSTYLKGFLKNNNWHYKVQGTIKRRGDLSSPNNMLTNTSSSEQAISTFIGYETFQKGLQVHYSYFRNELGILRSSHIGNTTDFQEAINRDVPFFTQPFSYQINAPKQLVSHQTIKATYYNRIKNNLKLTFQYAAQLNERKEFDIRRGGRTNIPVLNLWLQTHNTDVTLHHYSSKKWNGKVGVNLTYQNNYNIQGTGFRPILPNYSSSSTGIFLLEEYSDKKWHFELGLRYDYRFIYADRLNTQNINRDYTFNFHNAAFSGGIKYQKNEHLSLQSNLSSGFRPPNVFELLSEGLHQSAASIELGDASLKSERNIKWMSTLNLKSKINKIEVSLSPYLNYINNYIFQQPLPEPRLTIRGAFPVFQYMQTDALISGFDIDFNWKIIPQLSFQNKTSFLYGRDLTKKDDLIFMPPLQFNNTLTIESVKWLPNHKPYISFNHIAVLQQYWFPEGVDFIPPPKGYQLFNVYTGMKIPIKQHTLSISLQVENIFNVAYRDYLNRFRYYADNMGRNFSIKINYQFSHNPKPN